MRCGGGAARLADGPAHGAPGRVRDGAQAAHRGSGGGHGTHRSAARSQTIKICRSRPKIFIHM